MGSLGSGKNQSGLAGFMKVKETGVRLGHAADERHDLLEDRLQVQSGTDDVRDLVKKIEFLGLAKMFGRCFCAGQRDLLFKRQEKGAPAKV